MGDNSKGNDFLQINKSLLMCMLIEIKAMQNKKFVSLLNLKNKSTVCQVLFQKWIIKVWEITL